MKLSIKILAILSSVVLLAACETKPNAGGANEGAGVTTTDKEGRQISTIAPGVSDRVFFDYDSSVIKSDGEATLQKQTEYLKNHPSINVTIEGHCDERGTREYNLALGERRANAAKNYLVSLGVDGSRIQTISYGKERPAVIGDDESAWAQNRRAVTVKAIQ